MNWEDERYVRLYVRDTVTWKVLPWQGKCLLPLLLRKADRSGCVDISGAGAEGVAALVDVPIEVVEPGLSAILARGVAQSRGDALVFPKFIKAQEAKQSDKLRAQESRARRRDQALSEEERDVTKRDDLSHAVTDGHTRSQMVTPSLAVLSRAEPSLAVPENTNTQIAPDGAESKPAQPGLFPDAPNAALVKARSTAGHPGKPTTDQIRATATILLQELSAARCRIDPTWRPLKVTPAALEGIERLLKLKEPYTVAEIRHVIAAAEAESRHNPMTARHFNQVTTFRPRTFERFLAMTVDGAARPVEQKKKGGAFAQSAAESDAIEVDNEPDT